MRALCQWETYSSSEVQIELTKWSTCLQSRETEFKIIQSALFNQGLCALLDFSFNQLVPSPWTDFTQELDYLGTTSKLLSSKA